MTTTRLKLGAVLFEGFELLDVFGPLEMLGMLRDDIDIEMIGPKEGMVASAQGPRVEVQSGLANCRGFDILLVPGGRGTRRVVQDTEFLDRITRLSGEAKYVTSVCTGAAILAKTGLLNGRRATTNKLAWEWATSQGPKVTWVPEARWIIDGKYVTSAGVSSGMDMALRLIEMLFGRERADEVARQAEYDWHSDPAWDPFARMAGLVDRRIGS
jgi:transcriptional regulator GlxA family with amidase domain